jgi:hypothetical protein
MGDHGSPPWSAMNLYHNTFVMAEPARDAAMNALGSTRAGHPRRVFNNLFIHRARLPGFVPPQAADDVVGDGNWYWSPAAENKQHEALFAKFRASEQFAKSKERYAPGVEANSRAGDPMLTGDEYRPATGSPLIDAGVPVPPEWPDPLRDADAGRPDIGAWPLAR